MSSDEFSRRRFLRYLAGSPLFATAGIDLSWLEQTLQQAQEPAEIASAAEAINVFDFEPVARRKIPHAHWGYLMTGTDDDATIAANRAGYAKWDLRARRLVDISKIDTSVTLIGTKWQTPIFLCPLGSQKAFYAEGEVAVARAAKAKGHLQILSTVATSSIEDVIAARGAPVWYQLYHRPD
jgi:isopentenyl diphosphate isomerase/L-lactate dehydrogenase-like FMN-dependent dehydrogenase